MKKNYQIVLVCMLLSARCLLPMAREKVADEVQKKQGTDTVKVSDKGVSDTSEHVPKSDEHLSKKKDSLWSNVLTSEHYVAPRTGVIIVAAGFALGTLSYLVNKAYNWRVFKDEEEVRKMLDENPFARFVYEAEPKPKWFTRYNKLLNNVAELFPDPINQWISSNQRVFADKNPYDLLHEDIFNRLFDPPQRVKLLGILRDFERDFLNKEMETIFRPDQKELLAWAQKVGLDEFLQTVSYTNFTQSEWEKLQMLQQDPSRALLRKKIEEVRLRRKEALNPVKA